LVILDTAKDEFGLSLVFFLIMDNEFIEKKMLMCYILIVVNWKEFQIVSRLFPILFQIRVVSLVIRN